MYEFKVFRAKHIMFMLRNYFTLHLRLLNTITNNYWLYFIYILAIILSHFGCWGNTKCLSIHKLILILVLYLQNFSIELYVFCSISITRRWLVELVGEKYFLTHFLDSSQLVVKYYLPLFSFFLVENVSSVLLFYFYYGVT